MAGIFLYVLFSLSSGVSLFLQKYIYIIFISHYLTDFSDFFDHFFLFWWFLMMLGWMDFLALIPKVHLMKPFMQLSKPSKDTIVVLLPSHSFIYLFTSSSSSSMWIYDLILRWATLMLICALRHPPPSFSFFFFSIYLYFFLKVLNIIMLIKFVCSRSSSTTDIHFWIIYSWKLIPLAIIITTCELNCPFSQTRSDECWVCFFEKKKLKWDWMCGSEEAEAHLIDSWGQGLT